MEETKVETPAEDKDLGNGLTAIKQDNLRLRVTPKRIIVKVTKRADFLLQSETKCAFYDWALVGGNSCTTCKAYRGSKGKPRSGRFFVYCAAKEFV